MPEPILSPRPALGLGAPVIIGGLTISERTDLSLASLAARRGQEAVVAGLVGMPLPGPGRVHNAAPVTAAWTGPGQWMLLAADMRDMALARRVKERVGDAGSVTDQSGAWVVLDIDGAGCIALFERLCNLDLAAAPGGFASRTVIEHIGVLVLSRMPEAEQVQGWRILGPRSYATSLLHAVTAMARSIA